MAQTVYIALPAYNEQEALPALLGNLEQALEIVGRWGIQRRYVIVDDGSRDATPRILEEYSRRLPLTVVTHEVNQGLGNTIRDALCEAARQARGDDIILTMDADNTQPAGLMLRMVQSVLEGNQLVIASRYRYGSRVVGLSAVRRLMSWGARVLFQMVFPIPGVRDYTCGYRAYRADLLQQAIALYGDRFVEHAGFQSMADILLKLSRLRPIVHEVPMVLRYDLKGGASKMRVGRTVLNTLLLLARRRIQWWLPSRPPAGRPCHDAQA